MITVFLCEDSLDGILTGVYEAYDSRLGHRNIRLKTEEMDTMELFCEYRTVRTDLEKAEKVLRTVQKRMGEKAKEAVCYAAACPDGRRADAIYRLIVLGLSLPVPEIIMLNKLLARSITRSDSSGTLAKRAFIKSIGLVFARFALAAFAISAAPVSSYPSNILKCA